MGLASLSRSTARKICHVSFRLDEEGHPATADRMDLGLPFLERPTGLIGPAFPAPCHVSCRFYLYFFLQFVFNSKMDVSPLPSYTRPAFNGFCCCCVCFVHFSFQKKGRSSFVFFVIVVFRVHSSVSVLALVPASLSLAVLCSACQ